MRYDGVNEPQRRRTSCLPHCHVSSFICRLPLSLSVAPMLRDAKCENQQRHGDVYGAGTMAPHYGRIIKSIREVYPFLFFFSFLTKGFNNLTVYVYRDVRARPKGGGEQQLKDKPQQQHWLCWTWNSTTFWPIKKWNRYTVVDGLFSDFGVCQNQRDKTGNKRPARARDRVRFSSNNKDKSTHLTHPERMAVMSLYRPFVSARWPFRRGSKRPLCRRNCRSATRARRPIGRDTIRARRGRERSGILLSVHRLYLRCTWPLLVKCSSFLSIVSTIPAFRFEFGGSSVAMGTYRRDAALTTVLPNRK